MLLAETFKALENQNKSNNFFKNALQWIYHAYLFIAAATKTPIQVMSFQEELFNKS